LTALLDTLQHLTAAPGMSAASQVLLIVVSLATSAVSAAFGLGGGMMLIAVMAQIMPIPALVPVHGVVQMGSNGGRALVLLPHVNWIAALWYALGAVAGAILGGALAVNLPAEIVRLALGLFILWIVWGRMPRFERAPKRAMAGAGFVATGLSMVFGATGPIGAAVLAALRLPRRTFVATQAVTALSLHVFKIAVFGFLGFAFAPWTGLILAMIASGFIGTLIGTRLLARMSEGAFRYGFRLLMTVLAGGLVLRGLAGFLPA
jgi:uncharacterized membrane protein YfcA